LLAEPTAPETPRFDARCRGSVPGKLIFLARFDYGLCLHIVESAAFSQESGRTAIFNSLVERPTNGRPCFAKGSS
jgi:hypothetical protein